jgi:hypothetical protein
MLRHGNAHFAAGALQTPQDFNGFIGRDPSSDAEGHTGSCEFLPGLIVTHLKIEM